MRYDIKLEPETALERHVAKWLRAEARERNGSIASVYRDLSHGGCSSGMVGHLIYTADAASFYRRHAKDIDVMLREACEDCGEPPHQLFARAGWDEEDPLARDDHNQNVLAWFGFEEAARTLMCRADADI